MYRLTNVSWNELVRRLRKLGFEGPYLSSGPHPYFLKKGDLTVDLPNPHKQDIGVGLLKKVLKQAEISRKEMVFCGMNIDAARAGWWPPWRSA